MRATTEQIEYKTVGKQYLAAVLISAFVSFNSVASAANSSGPGPESWVGDLSPISADDWSFDRAAHLLERAGFGGTHDDIEKLAKLTPEQAVDRLVNYEKIDNSHLKPFTQSNIHDAGLVGFPPSRPATTKLAKENGEALGVKVKPSGNRPIQPVVNKFFYWLRASMLETRRIAYWWADRMLNTDRPLEEKMTLFWHGHFATTENKVREYRRMLKQNQTFRNHATGNFRELMIAVAQDPAMLYFLDAGVNVKGAPNENFAREIMELFTMGVGNYTEKDIREAARAFTGWNATDLTFEVDADKHDTDDKTFLGRTGNFDGVHVIDIILEQPVTAQYLSAKLYRYFVREDLSPELNDRIATVLRDGGYDLKPLLRTFFLSRDFYSPASMGTHIKGPVQLVVSTYKKLGLSDIPGNPDFNETTTAMGQTLFWPPTVAGWAQGRSWITPGLLLERGNFAHRTMFPDINFLPHDRYPVDPTIREVHAKVQQGADVTSATMASNNPGEMMAESNMMADRDEEFNTRYGSYRGWQMATQKVIPIPRAAAQINLSDQVLSAKLKTTEQAVDYFLERLLIVPVATAERAKLVEFLNGELGTTELSRAATYLEDPLRMLVHLIMSQPEYQLG